jgi:ABC-type multidrug transport system fused ATPase/permease subunit
LNILWILENRSFSKQSSGPSEDLDENDDEDEQISSDDPSKKKKKRFHTPFMFKILKLNGPEWPWILIGAICSIVYGASQPIFALLYSYIYGLFANPDLAEQNYLTSIYAGVIFAIGFIGGLSLFLSVVGFAKSGEELTMRMRKLTFSAMLRQEMGYFDQEANSVGALVTRLSSDASALKVNNTIANDLARYIYRV